MMNLNEWAARHEVAVADNLDLGAAEVLGDHGRVYRDDGPLGPRLLLRLYRPGYYSSFRGKTGDSERDVHARILAACRAGLKPAASPGDEGAAVFEVPWDDQEAGEAALEIIEVEELLRWAHRHRAPVVSGVCITFGVPGDRGYLYVLYTRDGGRLQLESDVVRAGDEFPEVVAAAKRAGLEPVKPPPGIAENPEIAVFKVPWDDWNAGEAAIEVAGVERREAATPAPMASRVAETADGVGAELEGVGHRERSDTA